MRIDNQCFCYSGSDPNRFYQGGFMGSSKARFKEAAKRDGIHHQMDLLQRKIEDRQKYLWDNFQVCFC